MNHTILVQRTAQEIERIGELLDVDISRRALPRSPDAAHINYHRLRVIRERLEGLQPSEPDRDPEDELLDRISRIEGIGPSTMDKIRTGLVDEPSDVKDEG